MTSVRANPDMLNANRAQCARQVSERHRTLLDQSLPLLASDWQQSRLRIADGDLEISAPGVRQPGSIDLILKMGEHPSLVAEGNARFVLTYNPSVGSSAQSSLLAIAAHGGLPIAGDEQSLALLTLAERIAKSDIPALLEGPTGTGKEVLARFVHDRSARSEGPFVAVNCAAMPEAMLEGLLFGHRKGAFTGAAESREGLFRAADGGTLLLDEIGELPLPLQAKLLRALQEGEVLPLGASKPIKVNTRIVAATNRTLGAEVEAGRFREDLLYRINVFPLEISALRDRKGDIAPLAFGMLSRHACRPGTPNWLDERALAMLEGHAWPGNVRELENVIRRAVLLAGDASQIGSEHIVFDQPVRAVTTCDPNDVSRPASADSDRASLSDIAFRSEAQAILDTLDRCDGHRARTARTLGISERTLRYRLASMRESGLLAAGGEA
ncbi:MAG: sigma 54-interacting transcriptional regulator [Pseudomonadota bacterium]